MNFSSSPAELDGRVLPPETLMFGRGKTFIKRFKKFKKININKNFIKKVL